MMSNLGCPKGGWLEKSVAVLGAAVLLQGCGGGDQLEISVTQVDASSSSLSSSSQLEVSWEGDSDLDSYKVVATDPMGGAPVETSTDASSSSVVLEGLKASTKYSIKLFGCQDAKCSEYSESAAVEVETPQEVWQLQGSGHSFADLTSIVSDGNARLSASWFGSDSSAGAMAGKVQLYYGPSPAGGGSGVGVGVMSGTVIEGDVASVSSFTSTSGSYGLVDPSTATSWIRQVLTAQGVPTGGSLGEKVRLFFEAGDASSRTRIFYLDSQDGYVGKDFHSQVSKSVCNTQADYNGGCLPTLVIGTSTDDSTRFSNIEHARQFKLGWPTLTDWKWTGDAGTFMFFTVNVPASCSASTHTMQGYAMYDGASQWDVQFVDSTGCPVLYEAMQAPSPVHLGAAKYKVYFGDPSEMTGKTTSSSLPWLGPKKVFYGDGSLTGDVAVVSVTDWEDRDQARTVKFLWPDGTELNEHEAGYIDDFQFLTPTGTLDFQVAYLTLAEPLLSGGAGTPKDGIALLLNP